MKYKKQASILSHLAAIVVLPFNVTVIIPVLLLDCYSYSIGWELRGLLLYLAFLLGVVSIISGLVLLVVTIKQFAVFGKGTLAPWDPPRKLVVDGPYRYTRNPMISAVVLILCGEMIIFGSTAVLLWFLSFTIINIFYIKFKEEPGLEKKFGVEYLDYKEKVPRIFPGKLLLRNDNGC